MKAYKSEYGIDELEITYNEDMEHLVLEVSNPCSFSQYDLKKKDIPELIEYLQQCVEVSK